MLAMDESWYPHLKDEFDKPYFKRLVEFVKRERSEGRVYPPRRQVFTAYKETPFNDVKVVLLGQDPYHGIGQAHGLSFSVLPDVPVPPSLRNIYQELFDDLGVHKPRHGYLMSWARQGVFLLNSVLTVRAQQAGSHQGKGWETFTDRTLQALNAREAPVVFVLWGRSARNKASFIDPQRHLILEAPHPSPLSAHQGFFGSRPFSQINEGLETLGLKGINWELPRSAEAQTG